MAATINKYDPLFPGFFPLFFPLFLSLFLSFSPQKIFLLLLLLLIIIIPVSSCSSGSLLPVFGSLFVPIARRLAHCVAMKDRRGGTPLVFTTAVARWRWRRRVTPSCPVPTFFTSQIHARRFLIQSLPPLENFSKFSRVLNHRPIEFQPSFFFCFVYVATMGDGCHRGPSGRADAARPITNPSGLDRSTHRRTRASGRLILSPGLICISGRRFPANQKTGTETE